MNVPRARLEAAERRGAWAAGGVAILGLLAGAIGCELIAGVDRSQIDDGSGGASPGTSSSSGGGGSVAGTGGATSSDGGASASSAGGGGGSGVACAADADCPGADTECQTRRCKSGHCAFDYAPLGTMTKTQAAMDCKVSECDGSGMEITVADDTDLPIDNNPCTDDLCTAGIPSNPALPPHASCGAGLVCDGFGDCLSCLVAADCPGQDTQCRTRTCDGNTGTCGELDAPMGTPCNEGGGTACDGKGACVLGP